MAVKAGYSDGLLASPDPDLKLVVTDSHNTASKAKIAAKFLEHAGRGRIPVGLSPRSPCLRSGNS